jgi:hypothetical protein
VAGIWVLFLSGCATAPRRSPGSVSDKLARAGLELVSENQAGIPPDRRGRYLPCRVIPGSRSPALAPHPAGYLMVGVRGKRSVDASVIRAALAAWGPGETLHLTIRRNPYRLDAAEWWESEVSLRLPDR